MPLGLQNDSIYSDWYCHEITLLVSLRRSNVSASRAFPILSQSNTTLEAMKVKVGFCYSLWQVLIV